MSKAKMQTFGNYVVQCKLGKGSYGEVFKVAEKREHSTKEVDDKYFALKVVKIPGDSASIARMASREQKILQEITHPNTVFYKESFYIKNDLCLVMEYCEGGTLYQLLRDKGSGLPEEQFIDYLRQIAEGVKYLHHKNIIHRDLKSKNLLLKDKHEGKWTIKIADFGVARFLDENAPVQDISKFVGTVYFMSPEMIKKKSYSFETDIWTVGCTCVEMGTSKYAFAGENVTQVKDLVNNRTLLGFDDINYRDDIKSLILRMLSVDPKDRPTPEDILSSLHCHAHSYSMSQSDRSKRRYSEGSSNSTPTVTERGISQTLPENILVDSLASIQAGREVNRSNLTLLQAQSARLQSDLVIEVGHSDGTQHVARIQNYYRQRRIEDAERKAKQLLGVPMFERLRYLFRALSAIDDGIRDLKVKLGEDSYREVESLASSLSSTMSTRD